MLKVAGILNILGAAACIFLYLLPKRWAEGDGAGPRLPSRSETDERRSRDQNNLTLTTREHQSEGQEQQGHQQEQQEEEQEQGGLREEKPSVLQDQTKSGEDGPGTRPQQDGIDGAVHEADDVWLELVAAGLPAQRNRCITPPCGEVCLVLSRSISYGRGFRLRMHFMKYVENVAFSAMVTLSFYMCMYVPWSD